MFFTRTVDTITAGLSRIVKDLEAHITTQSAVADKHEGAAMLAASLKQTALDEVAKAKAIAAKIAALLGV